jgi:site-specific DNA-cytosine methylase
MKTFATMFSGIEGAGLGLTNAGFQPTYAIDTNLGALEILKANHHTPTVIHADVRDVNYSQLPPVDLLWASPVCCNFSSARHSGSESYDDIDTAKAIISAATHAQSVIIENVPAYQNSESYRLLYNTFYEQGFVTRYSEILNASDYGNPASRTRFYAIFSRIKTDFRPSFTKEICKTNWVDILLANKQYWLKSKLTKNQLNAIDADFSRPTPGSIYAIERCGYYKIPNIYNSLSAYPCIKSHSHHDGKNPKLGYGKIGSYRSYMDFIYEGQSYSVTPQLLGILNGFPIDYSWGDIRAQASAGIGNAVVPYMAQIISNCLI